MNQNEYWDSVSDTKEFTTPFSVDIFAKYVNKNDRVLDVGCGYGRVLNELYQLGYKNLLGYDFSEKMIERGRKMFPYIDFKVKRSEVFDMEDNSADAVTLIAVLTCIVDDAEQKTMINEIKRVLRPGGILYINDFLINSDERNLNRYDEYKDELGVYGSFVLSEGAKLRHHSEQWLNELLDGFERLEYETQVYTTMNGHKSNGFLYIGSNNK